MKSQDVELGQEGSFSSLTQAFTAQTEVTALPLQAVSLDARPPIAVVAHQRRILHLCDWLPPDFGAVGQYQLAHAREDARAGNRVTLVGFSSLGYSEETETHGTGSLTIRRIHRPHYNRAAWLKRAGWTLGSNLALVWHARSELPRSDEVCFTGSPPFLVNFVMPLACLFGVRSRYRISDFHPECLIAAMGRTPWWLKPVQAVTRFWRRRVSVFEALGEDQKRRLLEHGVPQERIRIKRDTTPIEITGREIGDLRPPELEGRYVILYSGNWGIAHDGDTFIRALANLEPRVKEKIGVWLNCIGREGNRVEAALRHDASLRVHRSEPRSLRELPQLLASADCHLVTLKDAFVGYVIPSKVYGCIASHKSILYIGSRQADVHQLCVQSAAARYYQADCGDIVAVESILRELVEPQTAKVRQLSG